MVQLRRQMKVICLAVLAIALSPASIGNRAFAQVLDSTSSNIPGAVTPSDQQHNRKLRITLDRTTPRAFEPLYLVLTAERFLPDISPEVMVARGNENFQPVTVDAKAWNKSETAGTGDIALQRWGTVLQYKSASATTHEYLFPAPGEYKLLVKMGPDSTTLTLNVQSPEIGEQDAWDTLGPMSANIMTNSLDDAPDQGLVDACGNIRRRFPRSICAQYCTSYLDITRFKLAFNQSGKTGGVPVYGQIAADLLKDNDSFHGTFYGELTAFYACYTQGLIHKFDDLLKTAEAMTTRFTPFSDALAGMRMEVLQHMTPKVVPVDPNDLSAATKPVK